MEVMLDDPRRTVRRSGDRRGRERRLAHLGPEGSERRSRPTRRYGDRRADPDRRSLA